jgi:esterase/lipase superfamily enzyme
VGVLDLQLLAYQIVDRALREAVAEFYTGDISFWPTTPIGEMLPTPDSLQKFWRLLIEELSQIKAHLDEVNPIQGRPFLLEVLKVKDPQQLREKTGNDIVSLLGPFLEGSYVVSSERNRGDRFQSFPPSKPGSEQSERSQELNDPFDLELSEQGAQTKLGDLLTTMLCPPPSPVDTPPSPAKKSPRRSTQYKLDRIRQPRTYEDYSEDAAPESLPSVSAPDPNASLVRVFYATDRLQIHVWADGPQYDHERSKLGVIQYGECEISIPKVHKMGKLESPSFLKFEFRPDPKKHIVLTRTQSLDEEKFFEEVRLSTAKSANKEAFVFIHGYNVSFEAAARRTGQMAYDLQFVGAPIFYSWPSNDKFADYIKDETNITWSTLHFQIFLELLAQRSGAERIHIIAHSMGNRAVCDALKALSHDPESHVKFNHLVLAAPDIDAETFAELAVTLQRLSGRITLYESSNDKALQASKKIHGYARAGEPLLVIPGMDTIDASEIDTDFLGHSYFSDNWPLLSDIHWLLAEDKPPMSRFGLMEREHPKGKYYVFKG